MMLRTKILPNGDLEVVASKGDRAELKGLLKESYYKAENFFFDDLYETYYQCLPEKIGALTDAPILTDSISIYLNENTDSTGKIWYYSPYQVNCFLEDLIQEGSCIFTYFKE